jgi:hypothetical protein
MAASNNKKKSNRVSSSLAGSRKETAVRKAAGSSSVNNTLSVPVNATPIPASGSALGLSSAEGGCTGCGNSIHEINAIQPFSFAPTPPDAGTSSSTNTATATTMGDANEATAAAPPVQAIGIVPGTGRFRMTAKNATIRINRTPKQPDGSGGNTTIHIEGKNGQGQVHIQRLPDDNAEASGVNADGDGSPNVIGGSSIHIASANGNFSTPFAFQNNKDTANNNAGTPFSKESLSTTGSIKALTAAAQQSSGTQQDNFLSSVIKPDGNPVLFHPGAAARNPGADKGKTTGGSKGKGSGGTGGKDRSSGGSSLQPPSGVGSSGQQRGSPLKSKVSSPQKQAKKKEQTSSPPFSLSGPESPLWTTVPEADNLDDDVNCAPSSFLFAPNNNNTTVNTPTPAALSLLTQEEQEEALLKAAQQQHQQLLQIQQQQQQALQMMMMQLMMQQQEQGSGTSLPPSVVGGPAWNSSNLNDWSAALASATGIMNFDGSSGSNSTYNIDGNSLGDSADESLELARKLREVSFLCRVFACRYKRIQYIATSRFFESGAIHGFALTSKLLRFCAGDIILFH